MEKGTKKQEILDAALDLFSTQGYEATSMSQIGDAVGIKKASLYTHFKNKQEILDTIITELTTIYNDNAIVVNTDWSNPRFIKEDDELDADKVVELVLRQLNYSVHNTDISRVRRLMTIEQFSNPFLRELQTKHSYTDVYEFNLGFVQYMINQGVLVDDNPEIMAAQFAWPISMWMSLIEREPEREAEAIELIERHIRQFMRVYGISNI